MKTVSMNDNIICLNKGIYDSDGRVVYESCEFEYLRSVIAQKVL